MQPFTVLDIPFSVLKSSFKCYVNCNIKFIKSISIPVSSFLALFGGKILSMFNRTTARVKL